MPDRRAHGRRNLQPLVGWFDARTQGHKYILSFAQHPSPVLEGQIVTGHDGEKTIRGQSQKAVRVGAFDGQGRPIFRWKSVPATAIFVAGMPKKRIDIRRRYRIYFIVVTSVVCRVRCARRLLEGASKST